jgi:regulator of replication initiation timing
MATDRKHIAVYLDPAVEQALIAFCEQKGLKSKKGFMYSAGVNAALSAFFGIADIDNILQSSYNTPTASSTIPNPTASNTPAKSIDVEVLPGKPDTLSDGEVGSLRQELKTLPAENQRLQSDLGNLQAENADLKAENEALRTAQPMPNFKLPEAPDLLNQLKAKRKKATASLADIEAILEILEELTPDGGN